MTSDLARDVEAAVMTRGGRLQGSEIRFLCPAHTDEHPSADYNPGKGVWICRACGESGNYWHLAQLLGLIQDGHRPDGTRETRRWHVGPATHRRFDGPTGKAFTWEKDGKTGLNGLPTRDLPLYGDLGDDPQADVVVSEGEKATDALAALGFASLGTACGANAIPSSESLKPLAQHRGRVYLCQDNDAPGRQHMQRIAARLAGMGKGVYLIEWPDAPEKGDGYDYVKAGKTADDVRAVLEGAGLWAGMPESGAQPLTQEPFRLTDVGNGKRLVATHGPDIRYCYAWHTWLCWNGQRWDPEGLGAIEAKAKLTVQAMLNEAASMLSSAAQLKASGQDVEGEKLGGQAEALWKHGIRSEAAARIAAMIEMAKSEPGIPVAPQDLDADPWLLNCQNGTVDLHTGQLRPHRKSDLLTKLCPADFDPNAALALWDRFLSEAIPDTETRDYVQRCAGATVVGKAEDDLLLICHGEGGTGKGTFLNSFMKALGDYASPADLETFTTKRDPHGPQPDLARLQGRRMVAVSEVDTGGAVALLKRATGGDPILTRSHHQESFVFVPQFTLWIIANDRPRVPDTDTGIWRRMREIPFRHKFPSPDPGIRTTLCNPAIAGPAILAWAVRGCCEWQKRRLEQLPTLIQAATEEYRSEMDPLLAFLGDCCETTEQPGIATYGKAVWDAYMQWARGNGIKHTLGRKGFAQRLGQRFKVLHGRTGSRFLGLILKMEPVMLLGHDIQVEEPNQIVSDDRPPICAAPGCTESIYQYDPEGGPSGYCEAHCPPEWG